MLEKIVVKAEEMARSIRKVKQANVKNKMDTIREFKEKYAKETKSKDTKNNSPDSNNKKQLKSNEIVKNDEVQEDQACQSTKNLESIMKGFADFESNDAFEENNHFESSIAGDSLKMNKLTSHQPTDIFKSSFGINQKSRETRKRDRAHSENDYNFVVEMSKPPSSPK